MKKLLNLFLAVAVLAVAPFAHALTKTVTVTSGAVVSLLTTVGPNCNSVIVQTNAPLRYVIDGGQPVGSADPTTTTGLELWGSTTAGQLGTMVFQKPGPVFAVRVIAESATATVTIETNDSGNGSST